jgi:hypothetical protein
MHAAVMTPLLNFKQPYCLYYSVYKIKYYEFALFNYDAHTTFHELVSFRYYVLTVSVQKYTYQQQRPRQVYDITS